MADTATRFTIDDVEIAPLTSETFQLFADLNERNGGMFSSCWCTWFHPDCAERGVSAEGNRELKRRWVDAGEAHAALVVVDGEVVAWATYGTPEELPSIHHRKQYDKEADLVPDWRVTCIVVDKRLRRRGLSSVALAGALRLIAEAGGGIVEGYPHLVPEKRVNPNFLYNATQAVYEDAGFELVRRKGLKNTVMRQVVDPA